LYRFTVLVEDLNGLLATRLGRSVQLTEITEHALPQAMRRSNGLHQRPVSVLLAIFKPLMLSKKHLGRSMSVDTPRFKMVGPHHIAFSASQAENKACRNGKSCSKMKITRSVTHFG
jgi:hypothetical protein